MAYPEIDPRSGDRDFLALMAEREKRDLLRNQSKLRRRYEESLIEFMIAAWPHMGEAGECIINWHHAEIAEALEDLVEAKYDDEGNLVLGGNLVINQPPRTTKSTLLLCFNAWVWAQPSDRWNRLRGPHVKFLTVSYSSRLSEKFGTQFRRLILSEWYQALWGHQVIIRADQGSRSDFANTAGGSRFSGSIIGGVLGSGGDIQLIDDPQNYGDAESEIRRDNTTEAMRMLVNRVTDPRHTARILVMQRLHQSDATQYAIDNWSRKTQFICFPMRYDITRPDPRDHRENDGELLWPEIWTESLVREQEKELLEYGCTPAESPVLMADLTLKPISEVIVGDEVVGFTTEHSLTGAQPYGRPERRKLLKATVKAVHVYDDAEIVRLKMASGAFARCTRDHKWYARNRGPDRKPYFKPRVGRKLGRICETYLPELTGDDLRDAGWLGGFFDGEGTVSMSHKRSMGEGYRHSAQIMFYQGAGRNLPLCEKLEALLAKFDFGWTMREDERKPNKNAPCYGYRTYKLTGHNLSLYQRFLHIAQPNKWRERLIDGAYGARFVREWDEITEIVPDGREKVYALETTTGNYVVWGYASSNSAGQLQQRPIPRGGGIIKHEWWKTWPDDAEKEGLADLRVAYHCPVCKWADYVEGNWSSVPCPQCNSEATRFTPFPGFSYRIVSVDTNYGQGEQNSYSAATAWAIWHDKHGAPRLMLTDAWRGRPRLRGDPNARDPALKLGLVEIIYGLAKRRQTDLILIERKTRGTDLYNELERITAEWPFQLAFTDPTHKGSKTLRLESCVNMFVNGLVWAPNLDYATMVIEEVCGAPFMPFDDLMDTCLVAGTKVATKRGQIAIEEVQVGDEVFTPIGFRRVTWAGLTGVKPVITRGELSGTANHPTFLIDRGWSRLDTATEALSFSRLTLCDLIRLALPRQWYLWASGITAWAGSGNITSQSADRRESRKGFMSRFGNTPMAGKCRPAMRSTTSTTTRLIAILGIWSAYRLRCIGASLSAATESKWSSILSVFGRWQANGINQKRAENGIEPTLQRLCQSLMLLNGSGWLDLPIEKKSANGVARGSFVKLPSGNIAATLAPARLASSGRGATPFDLEAVNAALGVGRNLPSSRQCALPASTAPTSASGSATIMSSTLAQPSSIPVPIFNLSVEEAECFYANGVLVHNCTAALRHVRDHGLLLTGHEHRKEEVARTAFRGRQFDANEVLGLV